MGISITDSRNLITKKLVQVYREATVVKSFGRSFFKDDVSLTKNVSIEVERANELVAVDVLRGTDGNHNNSAKSTEKIFTPPMYSEYMTANNLDLYDVAIASNGSAPALAQLSVKIANDLVRLRDKIERAYERQTWQVFNNGVVSLLHANSIDFKRKAASMVDVDTLGDYWTASTGDPLGDLENGAKFLRTIGKSNGAVLNCVMGAKALTQFLANTKVQTALDNRRINLGTIKLEQRNSVGASPIGMVTAGSWDIIIWTYPEYYDVRQSDGSVLSAPYVPEDKFILLPEAPKFTMAFGAVPQLITNGNVPQTDAYLIREYLDDRKKSHEYFVESAGIAIPTAVDQIYTAKVVA